jgi:hypothetical protein
MQDAIVNDADIDDEEADNNHGESDLFSKLSDSKIGRSDNLDDMLLCL